jgi:predicted metal-dependent peptidase
MLEERKVQKAKITLMRDPKFALWSGILMVGRTSVVDNIPTACTNGRDEQYGRKFVAELKESELNFVVLHENLHKAFRHLTTWKKLHDEDHSLANQACDYVINLKLKDLDREEKLIAMPRYKDGELKGKPMGLIDERFRGLNAKQVFDILKEEEEEGGSGDDEGESGGDNEGGGGEGGGGNTKGKGKGKPEGFDEHDWDGAKEMTETEKKDLEREIDQAIRQGVMAHQKIAGTGGGDLDRDLLDLLDPKVDWREMLREFVKATCSAKDTSSWRRVNRRFLSTGVYMPSLIGEKVGHLVIGVDTSGSVGQEELSGFLTEVRGIAEEVKPSQVDLIYWDGRVASHEEYTESMVGDIINSTKPKGGGGTSPSCVQKYLKEKMIVPECIIMLTDGYVDDWGNDWTAPVLWTIVGGNDCVASNGKTIHVKD